MYQECQLFDDHNDIQFWLNDQYTAIELMLQYPHNLLLTEVYSPVEQQHQEQQQLQYSNFQQEQQKQQQQQHDLFYIDDFDYLYTIGDCMLSPNDSTHPSSPSSSLSSSPFPSLIDYPLEISPEPEKSHVVVPFVNSPQKQALNKVSTAKETKNLSPTKSASKHITKDLEKFCHQSLVLTPASQENKPFACHLCPRRFARKHDLQRHIRVHTCAKPYSCLSCTKSFARTDALKRHLRMEEKCRTSPIIQAMKEKGCRRYRNL